MKFRKEPANSWYEWSFHCPGCKCDHGIRTAGWPAPVWPQGEPAWMGDPDHAKTFESKWTFNGDVNAPTVSPSLHIWVKDRNDVRTTLCHSFVENGYIRFLGDCRHDLRGQTVLLPDLTD